MRNYVQPGDILTLVATHSFVSGTGYVEGSIFGVAANSGDIGDNLDLQTVGVWTFPGIGDVGDVAFFDNTAKTVTDTSAAGLYAIGRIVGKIGATVQVKLDDSAVVAVA
jgi:predicted RecA/RadA family phage recombinase